jgi:Cys-tRNA(Pro)/Cys-tRNA(Cys) deacylase
VTYNENMVYEDILGLLLQQKVPYKIHEHAPSVTFQDAKDYLDFPLDRLLKTIAFRVKNGPWVLAAIQGAERVDYKKLAAHFGISRDKLVRLTPEQVVNELGYPIGAVAPFPTNPDTKVVFDSKILTLGTVLCGTGRNDRTLEIAIDDLVRISGGSTAPIVQETDNG